MTTDIISIPINWSLCCDCVAFYVDDFVELNHTVRKVEEVLGARLCPPHMTDGYAHYRLILMGGGVSDNAEGTTGSQPSTSSGIDSVDPPGHQPTEPGARDGDEGDQAPGSHGPVPLSSGAGGTGQQLEAPGATTDDERDPPDDGTASSDAEGGAPPQGGVVMLVGGRPVLLGSKPLIVTKPPKQKSKPPPEPVWVDMVATGETRIDCRLALRDRCMLVPQQLPPGLTEGDEIELHGVRHERILVSRTAITPQLALDFPSTEDDETSGR